jgi:hypothetical protein
MCSNLLLQLAFSRLYKARWSAEIDDEWRRNLSRRALIWPNESIAPGRSCIAPFRMHS